MEKDVPDTKNTQQDNISFINAARLTTLTAASGQLWITVYNLTISSNMLPGWSFTAPLLSVLYHSRDTETYTH